MWVSIRLFIVGKREGIYAFREVGTLKKLETLKRKKKTCETKKEEKRKKKKRKII